MSKKLVIFLLFLHPIFSKDLSKKNLWPYLPKNPLLQEKLVLFSSEPTSEESLLRRGEVVFLVSLPFTLLLNTGVTYLVYQQATGKSNLPPYLWMFSITGGILFSTAIVAHDQAALTQEKTYFFQIRHFFKH